MNYYNEWDSGAASWLRELINKKLIPNGYVDERSITEVTPSDLEGFTQCHFFAGIGGWSLALQLAEVPSGTRLWTGSPPCQPFSVAGQSLGFDDERHLAPAFLRLIRECQPELLFGEQVAAAIGKNWLDFVFLNLEEKGYTCGAAVLPACSVGAPHKRDRLFFGAVAHGNDDRQQTGGGRRCCGETPSSRDNPGRCGEAIKLADTKSAGRANGPQVKGGCHPILGAASEIFGIGNRGSVDAANPYHSGWDSADWLGCRDGKFRPVESGTFPLANGIPARVGRLRGYGNAIVPQAAAEFVKAFMSCI